MEVSESTVHLYIRHKLSDISYILQSFSHLSDYDTQARINFAQYCLSTLDDDAENVKEINFSE